MAITTDSKIPRGWLGAGDLTVFLGFSRGHFDKEIKPRIDEADAGKVGPANIYRAAGVVKVIAENAARAERKKFIRNNSTRSDGGTLEALKIESLRKKNRIESIKLAELEQRRKLEAGELLSLADVQETLLPAAESLRKLGDQMGRKDTVSGREVQRRINAVVDRIRKAVE